MPRSHGRPEALRQVGMNVPSDRLDRDRKGADHSGIEFALRGSTAPDGTSPSRLALPLFTPMGFRHQPVDA